MLVRHLVAEQEKMATMTALQSSFTSLSVSSNSSFLGQRLLSPIALSVASPVTHDFRILVVIYLLRFSISLKLLDSVFQLGCFVD